MHLFRLFILRQLARERLRTATTVVGIAVGIGVVTAIQLTNDSSLRGFEAAVDALSGETSIQVLGTGADMDERLLRQVSWLEEVGDLGPVLEGDVRARVDAERPVRLRVLGIDILRDRVLRDYRLVRFADDSTRDQGRPEAGDRAPLSAQAFLRLLLADDSVILTERFAARHGLSLGESLDVVVGDRAERLTVTGLLATHGPAAAFDGRIALMDIAAAQLLLGRMGRLDRLDLRLPPGLEGDEAEALVARIEERLPAGLRVRRPEAQELQVDRMLEAFHVNLTALSYIALVVGLFLVYNTVSISVIARREEIGTLRAIGVTRRHVVALFLGEAAGLAVVGCGLGLVLARVMALGAVELTSTAVSVLYIATAAADPTLEVRHVLLAFGIGVPLALLAAAVPAGEAATISPAAVMRSSDTLNARFQVRARHVVTPVALFALAWWLSRQPAVGGLPLLGYAAALAVVFGAAWLVPLVLLGVTALGRRAARRLFWLEAWLANASIGGSIPRLSISVAALAVSLALTVAIAVMVASFRGTVIYWVGQTLRADIFVAPEAGGVGDTPLSAAVETRVRSDPDVIAVDQFRRIDQPYDGRLIRIGAGDFPVLAEHGNLLFKTPTDERDPLREAVGRDHVVASESFAVRFGHEVGDRVRLGTTAGAAEFLITAVYYDYSTDRGVLVMDKRTFARHYGERGPESLAVYLRPGADANGVRERLQAGFTDEFRVVVRTNATLRREVLRIFDSTFAITYALEVVAIGVAILGVVGTLLTLIIDRRRELAVLRLIGAARRQVRRMMILEAAVIGVASQAIGLAVGLGLSVILIYVINLQSFGWTLQFRVPVAFLAQTTVAIVITTALAGAYPAHRAASLETIERGGPE